MDPSIEAEYRRLLGSPGAGLSALADAPQTVGLSGLPDPLGDATAALEARRRQQVEGAGYDPDQGLYDRYSAMLGSVLGPTINERAVAAREAMRRGDMATANALNQSLALDFGQFLGSIKPVGGAVPYHLRPGVEPPTQHNPRGLPMDEASRMKRAQEMGFTTDAYHGSAADIPAFSTSAPQVHERGRYDGIWHASAPDLADDYARTAGNSAALQRARDRLSTMEGRYNRVGNLALREGWEDDADRVMQRIRRKMDALEGDIYSLNGGKSQESLDGQVIYPTRLRMENPLVLNGSDPAVIGSDVHGLARDAMRGGHDAMVIRGISDSPFADAAKADVYSVFHPANIRSRFATFDPERAHLSDLLASLGPWLVGGAGLGALGIDYLFSGGDEGM